MLQHQAERLALHGSTSDGGVHVLAWEQLVQGAAAHSKFRGFVVARGELVLRCSSVATVAAVTCAATIAAAAAGAGVAAAAVMVAQHLPCRSRMVWPQLRATEAPALLGRLHLSLHFDRHHHARSMD